MQGEQTVLFCFCFCFLFFGFMRMNRAINFNSISTVVFFMEFKKAGSFLSSKIRIFSIKVFFVASLAHKGCLFAPACIAAGFAVPYCLFFFGLGSLVGVGVVADSCVLW